MYLLDVCSGNMYGDEGDEGYYSRTMMANAPLKANKKYLLE